MTSNICFSHDLPSEIPEKPNLTWLDAAQVFLLNIKKKNLVICNVVFLTCGFIIPYVDCAGRSRTAYAHQGDQAKNHWQRTCSVKVHLTSFFTTHNICLTKYNYKSVKIFAGWFFSYYLTSVNCLSGSAKSSLEAVMYREVRTESASSTLTFNFMKHMYVLSCNCIYVNMLC